MRALVSPAYGPLDDLVTTDLETPRPGQGEVLLRTDAVSLNGIDPEFVTGAMKDFVDARTALIACTTRHVSGKYVVTF